MIPELGEILTLGIAAFMLAFARIGTAVMIMPGLGDSFAPTQIRLHIALGLTLALLVLILPFMPMDVLTQTGLNPMRFLPLLFGELIIGLLFGTMARIFMTALDTAGMVISIHSGLGSAQIFNPSMASQGSLLGAMLSISGVMFIFATNMHHVLIMGVAESYRLFPLGAMPTSGDMAHGILRAVAASFALGVALGGPFIAVVLVLYLGMGVLSRLMPQMQVFLVAIPLQILICLLILAMTLGTILMVWAERLGGAMGPFLQNL